MAHYIFPPPRNYTETDCVKLRYSSERPKRPSAALERAHHDFTASEIVMQEHFLE